MFTPFKNSLANNIIPKIYNELLVQRKRQLWHSTNKGSCSRLKIFFNGKFLFNLGNGNAVQSYLRSCVVVICSLDFLKYTKSDVNLEVMSDFSPYYCRVLYEFIARSSDLQRTVRPCYITCRDCFYDNIFKQMIWKHLSCAFWTFFLFTRKFLFTCSSSLYLIPGSYDDE